MTRNRAAAISIKTGTVMGFNPNLNGTVQAIAVSGSTVFLGGSFTQAGGKGAARLVAVNAPDRGDDLEGDAERRR